MAFLHTKPPKKLEKAKKVYLPSYCTDQKPNEKKKNRRIGYIRNCSESKDKIPATISESAQKKEVEFGHYLTTPSFECENKFVGMAAGCASREDEVGTYY
jgi:hypothetical protein